MLPYLGYCKQCCCEHWGACILLNHVFLRIYVHQQDCWVTWWLRDAGTGDVGRKPDKGQDQLRPLVRIGGRRRSYGSGGFCPAPWGLTRPLLLLPQHLYPKAVTLMDSFKNPWSWKAVTPVLERFPLSPRSLVPRVTEPSPSRTCLCITRTYLLPSHAKRLNSLPSSPRQVLGLLCTFKNISLLLNKELSTCSNIKKWRF